MKTSKNRKLKIRYIAYRKGVPRHHADVSYNIQYRFLGLFWIKHGLDHHLNRIPLYKQNKEELLDSLLNKKGLVRFDTTIIEYPEIIYH
jgi:hypothetical protein